MIRGTKLIAAFRDMDPKAPLEPVVIPPLQATWKSASYTCTGDGLLKHGHKYDPHYERYLPLLEPLRTKAGKIAVRQPNISKKPAAYWKAQCAFRNLIQSGSIADIQGRLRVADASLIPELAKIEKDLNREFREKNATARNEQWRGMRTNEEKANADPKRFLQEKFTLSKGLQPSGVDAVVVVLKTHNRLELHLAAEPLGLYTESVNAPLTADGKSPDIERWIIIGRDRASVQEKIREISRETVRSRQRAQEAKDERTRKLHMEVTKKAAKTGPAMAWNVTGSWSIKCPYMEDNWGTGTDECSLDIYSSKIGDTRQMWAQFDFIAITGIFRFENPNPTPPKTVVPATAPESLKRPAADFSDSDDEDEETGEFEDSESESDNEAFHLPPTATPSPQHRTWPFRWRGEETGEGEIQLYADEKLCQITFHGVGGSELKGLFESDLTGRIPFTGVRIGDAEGGGGDPDDGWRGRGEGAYENARVGRWR